MKKPLVGVALAGFVCVLPGSVRAAGTRLLTEFHPVAAEETARAAWINPAAIGAAGSASAVAEIVWNETAAGDLELGELSSLSFAAGTVRAAYAIQFELDDAPGIPNWTVVVARRVPRPGGIVFGSAIEWRGGEKQSLDGTVSLLAPLGSSWRGALVVEDVLAQDVDGVSGSRRWRGGLTFRSEALMGHLSYDYDRFEEADEGEHWFSAGLDRGGRLRAGYSHSTDGDWTARIGLVYGAKVLAGGLREADSGVRAAFAAGEWAPPNRILR